ncbi:MAG: hypothetical protein NC829_03030, partial [Candidatus Omnitrophica bacterium]|nr:hypothetical protein [Candidatus Omnitrophota bacterium]
MAISRIKKIELISLNEDKDRLMGFLQKLGLMELIGVEKGPKLVEPYVKETTLLEIEEAISYLAGFAERPSFLAGMIKLRPLVYTQEFKEIVAGFAYEHFLKELTQLRHRLKELTQRRETLIQERALVYPWQNLSIALDKLHPTENCAILLGVLRSRDFTSLSADLKKEGLNLFFEIVNQDATYAYLAIIYLKDDFEKLDVILRKYHFNCVTFAHHKTTVKDRLLEINIEVLILDTQIQDIKNKIATYAGERFKLMVVYDYLANIQRRKDEEKKLAFRQYTFLIYGWIREKDIERLKSALAAEFKAIALFISEPKKGEDVPTSIENKPLLAPFEAVTNLYGQPIYTDLDPTMYLAPFFALAFSFCLLDAGYGLILLLVMLYFLKKKQISLQAKNFLRLFLYAGFTTIVAGLITGNFFADLISRLPSQFALLKNIQQRFILFEPVKDALFFLGLSLAFGFIQVWSGVFIRFLRHLKKDRFAAFILDLPTLLVQAGLLVFVLTFFKVLPSFMFSYAAGVLILSAILVIYYHWKANPEIS